MYFIYHSYIYSTSATGFFQFVLKRIFYYEVDQNVLTSFLVIGRVKQYIGFLLFLLSEQSFFKNVHLKIRKSHAVNDYLRKSEVMTL